MLVGQFSPGPDFLLILKNALNHGRRAALLSVLGIAVGIAVHLSIALAGLAVLFSTASATGQWLRYLGAAYLVYLAIRLFILRPNSAAIDHAESHIPISDRSAFLQGLLTNLLNPKVVIFLSSVLAQFLTPESAAVERWIYAAITLGQALIFWALFVELLQVATVRRAFLRYQRPFNLIFATLLLLLALRAGIS